MACKPILVFSLSLDQAKQVPFPGPGIWVACEDLVRLLGTCYSSTWLYTPQYWGPSGELLWWDVPSHHAQGGPALQAGEGGGQAVHSILPAA